MAKLNVLEKAVCAALCLSVILWQESLSSSLGSYSANRGCTGFECPIYGRCVLDKNNQPKCFCPLACILLLDPVCGSDGKTHPNDCGRVAEACTTNTNITMLHFGRCGNNCTDVKCPFYGYCMEVADGRTTCRCSRYCPPGSDPVCGSDTKTYENTCELEYEACHTKTDITVVHKGICKQEAEEELGV